MAAPETMYPPAPLGVPADLAWPGGRYRLRALLLLLALFAFLLLYLVLVAASVYLVLWAVAPPEELLNQGKAGGFWFLFLLVRCGLAAAGVMIFCFLFKGFFKKLPDHHEQDLEITQVDQPALFQFVRQLGAEIGSPLPARIFLNHDVNAAISTPLSFHNLLRTPPKHLTIGLGLVNFVNLVEFKAMLAHEFGHTSQRTLGLSNHVFLVFRLLENMVATRDRWDLLLHQACSAPWLSAFAVPVHLFCEGLRTLLVKCFLLLRLAQASLRRQMELNADLVAVAACGSDALVHLLYQLDFQCNWADQAQRDLLVAAEHGMCTRDLYFHCAAAGQRARAAQKDPKLGLPPRAGDKSTAPSPVFSAQASPPSVLWVDHPSHVDREQNAKRRYFPSPVDERSAWDLFTNVAQLRSETTRLWYQAQLPDVELPAPVEPDLVETFLAEERRALDLGERYHGGYFQRDLALPSYHCLLMKIGKHVVADPSTLIQSHQKLYAEPFPTWAQKHRALMEEFLLLKSWCTPEGQGSKAQFDFRGQRRHAAEAPDLLTLVREELDDLAPVREKFDLEVFLRHHQVAVQVGRAEELLRRYRFQLEAQEVLSLAWRNADLVNDLRLWLARYPHIPWNDVEALKQRLAAAGQGFERAWHQAENLVLPPLVHLPANVPLAQLLPDLPQPPDLSSADTAFDPYALAGFQAQGVAFASKIGIVVAKSLSGLLAFQEQLVQDWHSLESTTADTGS